MLLARLLRSVGELLITSGVVVLLFVVYTLYVTDLINAGTQSGLITSFNQRAAAVAAAPTTSADPGTDIAHPAIGTGIAVLRIPRLGNGYDPVIVEGVATADLQKGPGHYPGSALPGGDGNFVVSGHRTTYGKPFSDLDQLQVGDSVVVETLTDWYVYKETKQTIVQPTDIEVVDSIPPDETMGQKLITFTTCNPRYSASQRLVMRGVLVEATKKSDKPAGWVPSALEKGAAPDADKDLAAIPASAPVVQSNPAAKSTGSTEPTSFQQLNGPQGAVQALDGAR